MENRVKTRLSRIFRGSLNSCKTKNLLDVVEDTVLIPQNHQPPPHISSTTKVVTKPSPHISSTTKVVTKPSPLPSFCKPRHNLHEKAKTINDVTNSIVPRRKLYSFLAEEGFKCPTYSSCSDKRVSKNKEEEEEEEEKKKKKKKAATAQERKRSQEASQLFRSYSQDSAYYYDWFSSEEEDSVFFSSRSNTISSDSSGYNIASSKRHRPRKEKRRRQRVSTTTSTSSASSSRYSHNNINNKEKEDVNVMRLMGDPGDRSSIKDSFPVVKTSSDPHSDFRTSMVEIIIEKQIFGAEELEHLLRCFLSLNSDHHHGILFQVFDEICEALFSS